MYTEVNNNTPINDFLDLVKNAAKNCETLETEFIKFRLLLCSNDN